MDTLAKASAARLRSWTTSQIRPRWVVFEEQQQHISKEHMSSWNSDAFFFVSEAVVFVFCVDNITNTVYPLMRQVFFRHPWCRCSSGFFADSSVPIKREQQHFQSVIIFPVTCLEDRLKRQ